MNKELRSEAIRLRIEKEMSYSAIKSYLGVSKSTLSYWLREYPLSPDKIRELKQKGWSDSETSRELFRETMRSKKEKISKNLYTSYKKSLKNINDQTLFVAGLMLYLAEGDKKNANRICLANTDARIIIFFISWLNKFFEIKKDQIKIQLHLYEDMNVEAEKEYWRSVLSVEQNQFYKSSIRKIIKASFSYKESFRHGTCSLYVLNTQKKTELMMAMNAFLDLYKDI